MHARHYVSRIRIQDAIVPTITRSSICRYLRHIFAPFDLTSLSIFKYLFYGGGGGGQNLSYSKDFLI